RRALTFVSALLIRPRRPLDGAFYLARPEVRPATQDKVPNFLADTEIAGPSPSDAPQPATGLLIRAQEPSDWQEITALRGYAFRAGQYVDSLFMARLRPVGGANDASIGQAGA